MPVTTYWIYGRDGRRFATTSKTNVAVAYSRQGYTVTAVTEG